MKDGPHRMVPGHDGQFRCARCGMRWEPMVYYPVARRRCRRRLGKKLNARWEHPRGWADRRRHQVHAHMATAMTRMMRETLPTVVPAVAGVVSVAVRTVKEALSDGHEEMKRLGILTDQHAALEGIIVRGDVST